MKHYAKHAVICLINKAYCLRNMIHKRIRSIIAKCICIEIMPKTKIGSIFAFNHIRTRS